MDFKDVSGRRAPEPDSVRFIRQTQARLSQITALSVTGVKPRAADHHRIPLVSALAAARSLSLRARIASARSFQDCSIK